MASPAPLAAPAAPVVAVRKIQFCDFSDLVDLFQRAPVSDDNFGEYQAVLNEFRPSLADPLGATDFPPRQTASRTHIQNQTFPEHDVHHKLDATSIDIIIRSSDKLELDELRTADLFFAARASLLASGAPLEVASCELKMLELYFRARGHLLWSLRRLLRATADAPPESAIARFLRDYVAALVRANLPRGLIERAKELHGVRFQDATMPLIIEKRNTEVRYLTFALYEVFANFQMNHDELTGLIKLYQNLFSASVMNREALSRSLRLSCVTVLLSIANALEDSAHFLSRDRLQPGANPVLETALLTSLVSEHRVGAPLPTMQGMSPDAPVAEHVRAWQAALQLVLDLARKQVEASQGAAPSELESSWQALDHGALTILRDQLAASPASLATLPADDRQDLCASLGRLMLTWTRRLARPLLPRTLDDPYDSPLAPNKEESLEESESSSGYAPRNQMLEYLDLLAFIFQNEPSLIDAFLALDHNDDESSSSLASPLVSPLVSLVELLARRLSFDAALLPPLARMLDAMAARPQASQLVSLLLGRDENEQVRWQTICEILLDGVVYYAPASVPALLPSLVSPDQQRFAQAQQAGQLAPPQPAELIILLALLRLLRALRHCPETMAQLHADYALVHALFALLSSPHLPSDIRVAVLWCLLGYLSALPERCHNEQHLALLRLVWDTMERVQVLRTHPYHLQQQHPPYAFAAYGQQQGVSQAAAQLQLHDIRSELQQVERGKQRYPLTLAFTRLLLRMLMVAPSELLELSPVHGGQQGAGQQGVAHGQQGVGVGAGMRPLEYARFVIQDVFSALLSGLPFGEPHLHNPIMGPAQRWSLAAVSLRTCAELLDKTPTQPQFRGASAGACVVLEFMSLRQAGRSHQQHSASEVLFWLIKEAHRVLYRENFVNASTRSVEVTLNQSLRVLDALLSGEIESVWIHAATQAVAGRQGGQGGQGGVAQAGSQGGDASADLVGLIALSERVRADPDLLYAIAGCLQRAVGASFSSSSSSSSSSSDPRPYYAARILLRLAGQASERGQLYHALLRHRQEVSHAMASQLAVLRNQQPEPQVEESFDDGSEVELCPDTHLSPEGQSADGDDISDQQQQQLLPASSSAPKVGSLSLSSRLAASLLELLHVQLDTRRRDNLALLLLDFPAGRPPAVGASASAAQAALQQQSNPLLQEIMHMALSVSVAQQHPMLTESICHLLYKLASQPLTSDDLFRTLRPHRAFAFAQADRRPFLLRLLATLHQAHRAPAPAPASSFLGDDDVDEGECGRRVSVQLQWTYALKTLALYVHVVQLRRRQVRLRHQLHGHASALVDSSVDPVAEFSAVGAGDVAAAMRFLGLLDAASADEDGDAKYDEDADENVGRRGFGLSSASSVADDFGGNAFILEWLDTHLDATWLPSADDTLPLPDRIGGLLHSRDFKLPYDDGSFEYDVAALAAQLQALGDRLFDGARGVEVDEVLAQARRWNARQRLRRGLGLAFGAWAQLLQVSLVDAVPPGALRLQTCLADLIATLLDRSSRKGLARQGELYMPICGLVCILAERLRVSLLADPTLGILAASQAISKCVLDALLGSLRLSHSVAATASASAASHSHSQLHGLARAHLYRAVAQMLRLPIALQHSLAASGAAIAVGASAQSTTSAPMLLALPAPSSPSASSSSASSTAIVLVNPDASSLSSPVAPTSAPVAAGVSDVSASDVSQLVEAHRWSLSEVASSVLPGLCTDALQQVHPDSRLAALDLLTLWLAADPARHDYLREIKAHGRLHCLVSSLAQLSASLERAVYAPHSDGAETALQMYEAHVHLLLRIAQLPRSAHAPSGVEELLSVHAFDALAELSWLSADKRPSPPDYSGSALLALDDLSATPQAAYHRLLLPLLRLCAAALAVVPANKMAHERVLFLLGRSPGAWSAVLDAVASDREFRAPSSSFSSLASSSSSSRAAVAHVNGHLLPTAALLTGLLAALAQGPHARALLSPSAAAASPSLMDLLRPKLLAAFKFLSNATFAQSLFGPQFAVNEDLSRPGFFDAAPGAPPRTLTQADDICAALLQLFCAHVRTAGSGGAAGAEPSTVLLFNDSTVSRSASAPLSGPNSLEWLVRAVEHFSTRAARALQNWSACQRDIQEMPRASETRLLSLHLHASWIGAPSDPMSLRRSRAVRGLHVRASQLSALAQRVLAAAEAAALLLQAHLDTLRHLPSSSSSSPSYSSSAVGVVGPIGDLLVVRDSDVAAAWHNRIEPALRSLMRTCEQPGFVLSGREASKSFIELLIARFAKLF